MNYTTWKHIPANASKPDTIVPINEAREAFIEQNHSIKTSLHREIRESLNRIKR